ncbi:MAG: hypothetical protein AB7W37_08925 [Syntrophobacteraceae bacterium]
MAERFRAPSRALHIALTAIMAAALMLGAVVFPYGEWMAEHFAPLAVGIMAFGAVIPFCKNYRRMLAIGMLCLPLTQAPTLKALIRWRVSEVVGWIFLLKHLKEGGATRLPREARVFVMALALYFLYTGTVGAMLAGVTETPVEKVLEYYVSPFFRSLLETARGAAALGMVLELLRASKGFDDLRKWAALLALGGGVSGGYALYQSFVGFYGLPLPLLPGTLSHPWSLRPFGTFYEPTGTGSFLAAAMFLDLYLLTSGGRRGLWAGCLAVSAMGFFASLSRAGWLGLAAGAVVLAVCTLAGRGALRAGTVARRGAPWKGMAVAIIAVCALALGGWAASGMMGSANVNFALSWDWLRQSAASRISAYAGIPSGMLDCWGVGFGQGLLIFREGGAPGFVRLILEGGIVGMCLLAILHACAVRSLGALLSHPEHEARRYAAFLAAAYASCAVTTCNYINTTDMWIWVVWALPVISMTAIAENLRH